jgi:hypothetical protein
VWHKTSLELPGAGGTAGGVRSRSITASLKGFLLRALGNK